VRTGGKPMDSIGPWGFGYWELLADAIAREPVEPRDRFFHAMLKPIGLKRETPSHRTRVRRRSSPTPRKSAF
jgi:hypothetical protein